MLSSDFAALKHWTSKWAKPLCSEQGVVFARSARVGTANKSIWSDEVLLDGDEFKEAWHVDESGHQLAGRKSSDCLFFLRRSSGEVQLAVAELKSGTAKVGLTEFVEKVHHSIQDCLSISDRFALNAATVVLVAAPRLPPNLRQRHDDIAEACAAFTWRKALRIRFQQKQSFDELWSWHEARPLPAEGGAP